jgi:hypothetical protein
MSTNEEDDRVKPCLLKARRVGTGQVDARALLLFENLVKRPEFLSLLLE